MLNLMLATMTALLPLQAAVANEPVTRSPLNPPGSIRHWAPSRAFHQEHIKLLVIPSCSTQEVAVTTELHLVSLVSGLAAVKLDALGLRIKSVKVDGVVTPFVATGDSLVLSLERPRSFREKFVVTIESQAGKSEGFVFSAPGKAGEACEFFSYGEAGANAFWFPACQDPDDRCTFQVSIKVPRGQVGVSNGRRVALKHLGASDLYTYRLDQPIPTYLVAVAGGPFIYVQDGAAKLRTKTVKLGHWIAADRKDWTADHFQSTAKVLKLFSTRLGMDFPWSHYDVVVLRDMNGGMEYPTCTFVGANTFFPKGGRSDAWPTYQALLLHEVAHSWFGDFVTNRTWGEGWLNEGLASYLAAYALGELEGPEMFEWALWSNQEGYKTEDRGSYRRALSTSYWVKADDTLDGHAYFGGAARIHMLRHLLGEERFWASLKVYLTRHGNGPVQAEDLRSAIHAATGESLEEWFAAWVYGAGYPELETSECYDPSSGVWTATIKQVQAGARETAEVFPFPLDVRLELAGGTVVKRFWVNGRTTTVTLPAPSTPLYAVLDDGQQLAKTMVRDRPLAELAYQVRDRNLGNRLAALQECQARLPGAACLDLLVTAFREDPLEEAKVKLLGLIAEQGADGTAWILSNRAGMKGRVLDAAMKAGAGKKAVGLGK